MTFKRALLWSIFWIGLSLLTALAIGLQNSALGFQFLAGWTIEKILSVDNLFVFLMLFTYFNVDSENQRRVLNFGILGVIVTRGILIFAGIALVQHFEWIMYLLGAIVVYTGVMMILRNDEDEFDGDKNWIVRLIRKFIPITSEYHGSSFFVRKPGTGKKIATPLLVVLLVVEVSDIVFSLDSVPAVFSVTRNPFIVFGSNILAVLGLRSLYFLLERMEAAFIHLKKAVGVILWFVGLKMILPLFFPTFTIATTVSLAVIVSLLLLGVLSSYIWPAKKIVAK